MKYLFFESILTQNMELSTKTICLFENLAFERVDGVGWNIMKFVFSRFKESLVAIR